MYRSVSCRSFICSKEVHWAANGFRVLVKTNGAHNQSGFLPLSFQSVVGKQKEGTVDRPSVIRNTRLSGLDRCIRRDSIKTQTLWFSSRCLFSLLVASGCKAMNWIVWHFVATDNVTSLLVVNASGEVAGWFVLPLTWHDSALVFVCGNCWPCWEKPQVMHDLVKVAGVVNFIACILLLFVCVGSCRHSHSGSLWNSLAFLKCLLWLTLPSGTWRVAGSWVLSQTGGLTEGLGAGLLTRLSVLYIQSQTGGLTEGLGTQTVGSPPEMVIN